MAQQQQHSILSSKTLLILANALFTAVSVNGLPLRSVPSQIDIPATHYTLLPAGHDPNINEDALVAPEQTCADCFQSIRTTGTQKPLLYAAAFEVCSSIVPAGCAIKPYTTLYGLLTPPETFQAPLKLAAICWVAAENGEGAQQLFPTVDACPSKSIAARDPSLLRPVSDGAQSTEGYHPRPIDPNGDRHNRNDESLPVLLNGHMITGDAAGVSPNDTASLSTDTGRTGRGAGRRFKNNHVPHKKVDPFTEPEAY
ncbi:MAG: hypothetical protein M1829_000957 [Trizodia sp. TS-e1964]|nr:MAG: hypothetical protein M1829_000957 [Trizodia sp. TS-e1964]